MNLVDALMTRWVNVVGVATLLVPLLSMNFGAGSSPRSNDDTLDKSKNVIGKWKKISTAKCDETYPDELEFFEARYLGKKGQGQRFIWWDAGGYQVVAADRVKIGIATDEQVIYRFSVSENVLTFVDREGCEFQYRRVA